MNKPLVTVFGGSGFLGRHAVRALAKAGYRIRVAVRRPLSANFLPPMGTVGQIQLLKCEVQDKDQAAAALAGADAVVNLTGILYQSGRNSFESLHVEAAETIAQAAHEMGIKTLVHVSVLGADPQSPSQYACTKGEGEAKVRAAFPDAAILRPSLVFGPEDRLFNKFAALARLVPVLPLIGGGKTRFQPVFVGDVAAAILRCVQDTGTHGKTYELGGPAVYSTKELMRTMLDTIGRKRLLVPVPFFLAQLKAFFLQMSKLVTVEPLLTPDQVMFLKADHVVEDGALTIADLGVTPIGLEAVIPSYLWRFRAKGQFEDVTSRAPAPQ